LFVKKKLSEENRKEKMLMRFVERWRTSRERKGRGEVSKTMAIE